MLFSATQTTKVTDLARMSLRPGPLYINVDTKSETSTANNLEQGYVVCDSDKRFLLLFSFLRKNLKKKVIVFFSSCKSVQYHAELLNYIDVPTLDLHVRLLRAFKFGMSCTVLTRVILYRSGQAKTAEADKHLLRVQQLGEGHPPLYGRRRSRTRHSARRLDHPVRPAR